RHRCRVALPRVRPRRVRDRADALGRRWCRRQVPASHGGPVNAPISPEPFLRGNAWAGTDEIPYPRADPADLDRLPGDTVGTARLPVSVRLELVGRAEGL